jgi:hypothetical protein
MPAAPQLRAALLDVMRRGISSSLSDTEFDFYALRVFAHQYEHNLPYRKYCDRRGRTPANVDAWTDVPAVPTGAFKEVALVAGEPQDAQLTFRTSGTTRGAEKRGVHYILDPSLYEASLLPAFQTFVLDGAERMRMLSLIAPADDAPDSSLSYMITAVMRQFGSAGSAFYANRNGIDLASLNAAVEHSSEPVCLLGTSLAYAHWMESLGDKRFALPTGSRLMDTGGFKGESRAFTSEELRSRYESVLGIPRERCINEYGMTELCSQYYASNGTRRGPPWVRARVVNPEDLRPVARGETGILQHFDLANLDSVSAIQTEDLGRETADGFVLIGRAPGAVPRGCSIAMDMLLSNAGPQ